MQSVTSCIFLFFFCFIILFHATDRWTDEWFREKDEKTANPRLAIIFYCCSLSRVAREMLIYCNRKMGRSGRHVQICTRSTYSHMYVQSTTYRGSLYAYIPPIKEQLLDQLTSHVKMYYIVHKVADNII
jgi:hypothetical protein